MQRKKDYIRDIAQMRTMMERSSKFLSLSGLAGIMAGMYALSGACIAHKFLYFTTAEIIYGKPVNASFSLQKVILLAVIVLILAIGTAIFLSNKKANRTGDKIWNPTAKRLLINMAVPLVAGGLLIIIFIDKGLTGFMAPLSLLFYGLALYNGSKFTYEEVRTLGLIQVGLGLISTYFVQYSLLLWAVGFGMVHIIYGFYMHYKYER